MRISVSTVNGLLDNHAVLVANTTKDVNSRVIGRVTICRPTHLILMSTTRAPVRSIHLFVDGGCTSVPYRAVIADVAGTAHVRRVFSTCRPSCMFRTTTCGRIPVVRSGPSRTMRGGVCNAHIVTSVTIGCNAGGFIVVSASGTIGPAGIVKYDGQVYRVCYRSLGGTVMSNGIGKIARFIAAHFNGILNDGNSIVPVFGGRVTVNNPVAIARPSVVHFFVLVPRTYGLMLRTNAVNGKNRVFIFSVNGPIHVTSLTGHVVTLSNMSNVSVGCMKLHSNRGLCRRILGSGRTAMPARRPGVVMTGIHRCPCRLTYRGRRRLCSLSFACSSVTMIGGVGRVIPRCGDRRSGCTRLST